jgi:hypothetical protein
MKELDEMFLAVEEKILLERSHRKGQFRFSEEVRLAVVDLVSKVGSPSFCAKRLGLSDSLVYKWNKLTPICIPPPRRLAISSELKNPLVLTTPKRTPLEFEAVLGNGIVLKGLPLTLDCLQILGGVQ